MSVHHSELFESPENLPGFAPASHYNPELAARDLAERERRSAAATRPTPTRAQPRGAAARANAVETRRLNHFLNALPEEPNEPQREALRALWAVCQARERFSAFHSKIAREVRMSTRWFEDQWAELKDAGLVVALDGKPLPPEAERTALFYRTRKGYRDARTDKSVASEYDASVMVKALDTIGQAGPESEQAAAIIAARVVAELRSLPTKNVGREPAKPATTKTLIKPPAAIARTIGAKIVELVASCEHYRDSAPSWLTILDGQVQDALRAALAEQATAYTPDDPPRCSLSDSSLNTHESPWVESPELAEPAEWWEPEAEEGTQKGAAGDDSPGVSSEPESPDSRAALAAFEAAGATDFFSVWIDDREKAEGRGDGFRASVSETAEQFTANLARHLERAESNQWSLCVRPAAPNLVQIDDCPEGAEEYLRPFAFLPIETSPASFQVWIALDCPDAATFDLTRKRLLGALKDTGANGGAFGSVRWPGSRNYKPGRRQPDGSFPLVRIVSVNAGRTVTPAELDAAGLLADPEPEPPKPSREPSLTRGSTPERRGWPDHDRCLRDAPKAANHDGPDRSKADYEWCRIALDRGHTKEDVAARLVELSSKARERKNPSEYAAQTAASAADFLRAHGRASVWNA